MSMLSQGEVIQSSCCALGFCSGVIHLGPHFTATTAHSSRNTSPTMFARLDSSTHPLNRGQLPPTTHPKTACATALDEAKGDLAAAAENLLAKRDTLRAKAAKQKQEAMMARLGRTEINIFNMSQVKDTKVKHQIDSNQSLNPPSSFDETVLRA